MLTSILALILGCIAVLIAMSMRSHILSIREQLSKCNMPAIEEVVEDFIDAPYTSGTERCVSDPLIPTDTEPPRDYIFTKMGLDNPYWDEEGYALEQINKSDKENPPPKNSTGEYAKARIIPVIGTEWEYTQCPTCLHRYNYRGTI